MLKAFGQGTLGRDAELRYTPSGAANLQWTMAFNTGWGDNAKTTWVRATLWGDRAEKLEQHLTKGTRITVAGSLELREYEKGDGSTGYSLDMRVDDFAFASSKNSDSSEESGEEAVAASKPKARGRAAKPEVEEEIPF